ncbi:MAG TPA: translation initiation factor IF-2 [Pirellulales bacterium]|nr:translation initiation factor IF-2 [Pirellulales bacterium]
MPVRIYSFAKDKNIDSKEMVEICAKAGVPGKGSALASLTDEEVVKVNAYLAGGAAKPSKPAVAAVASTSKAGTATLAPPEPPKPLRPQYIPPTGVPNKPPVLSARSERPSSETPKKPAAADGDKPPAPRVAGIRFAPLPNAQQPSAPSKPEEPRPQEPDLKLTSAAFKRDKAGAATPLSKHLQQHEAKKKADIAAGKSGKPGGSGRGAGADPSAPALPPLPGTERRDRGKRSGKAVAGKDDNTLMGTREQRQQLRKRTGNDRPKLSLSGVDEEQTRRSRRPKPRQKRMGVNTAAPRKGNIPLQLPCTVRTFCAAIGVPSRDVLTKLLALGKLLSITADLDAEMIDLLALEFGAEVEVRQAFDPESELHRLMESQEDSPASLESRAPVVTFLGHVDHGKTSLLDKIIGIDVVSGESGGITQHIRAYRIDRNGRPIAFVDTPGHEAFTEMRARGANVTDIAVLVVAADDGVMPQTEEAISHARAAGVPIVVALNKMDLPGINIERILQQLATNELLPTEWGGDTEVVKCSAMTGAGVDDLLETLLTIAELHDYQANPNRQAYGTCLEAEIHEGRGVVAKLLVQNGNLKVGDVVVCGAAYGRVKAMYDTLQPRVTHDVAGPATPVNVTGLDQPPGAGEHFYVLDDITQARGIAENRNTLSRRVALSRQTAHVTLETLHERLGGDEAQTLNLILRADTQGSIEAIIKEFTKLEHPEVQIKVLQKTVGGVTEADVYLADVTDAIIIGFNVVPDENARSLAEERGVQIRRYEIIYQVTDDLKLALEGMLKPEQREVVLGRSLVQRTFVISRLGTIAGCRVLSGAIERNCRVRVIRDSRIIGDYPLESLKREKDDAREVREGMECGMKLRGFNDLKDGDLLEAYKVEEVARTL